MSSRRTIWRPGYVASNGTLTGGQTVTPLTLTVTGITANNKTYDGTTSATAHSISARRA